MTKKVTVLDEAAELIRGQRQKDYGPPDVNFNRIADSWNAYLGHAAGEPLTPVDVCHMMILLKAQRLAEGYHRDTIIDIAGYAALSAVLAGEDPL